jgi:peptidoglycan/xylan/chitin deacetylase (PgdA/CDA1 family)
VILLSFDIEEFDMPFEYGKEISFEDQISISVRGTHSILDLLQQHGFKATFFSTVIFAQQAPEVIARIKNEGHELASHSFYHSKFEVKDLLASKEALTALFGGEIYGFRMPRMMPVDEKRDCKCWL